MLCLVDGLFALNATLLPSPNVRQRVLGAAAGGCEGGNATATALNSLGGRSVARGSPLL